MARCGLVLVRIICVLALLAASVPGFAYSLLTHEQIIDLTWDDSIVPLLLSRYPGLTPAQLDEARAYAYGGCVIQDIGYYPFGQASLSNLTHYVRSGDFVMALFRNAHNANELAFAVGALSHYVGDSIGHPLATNLSVPITFTELGEKYGKSVNYAQGKVQHVEVEFAFDVDEDTHGRTAPIQYLRKIGMSVSMQQLSLAYYQTYGVSMDFSGTRKRRVNEKAYRFAVRSFVPDIADATGILHKRHMTADLDTPEAKELHGEIHAMSVANNWAAYRHGPGFGAHVLAGLIFIMPRFGPFRLCAIKGPTPQAEADYVHSLMLSVAAMRQMLARFTPPEKRRAAATDPPAVAEPKNEAKQLEKSRHAQAVSKTRSDPHHPLPNRDLDTGAVVKPGGYPLTDSTYAYLLHTLTSQPTVPIPQGIKEDIQAYYADLDVPFATKKHSDQWKKVLADLQTLKTMPTSPFPEPFPTYEEEQGQE
ncbi:zinc dependent phospholipase C family protein [Occallatibacter riparius]|uniref:Zinc dependent phospholipase C family protein n=1 Tax=Occallatibacter riparius TaxID=1002689 RepID=A0A9J7BI35_9BACT|nr:zinc dependent phospholipase C family protein [Occallatibacter riparius]UWZ82464.1 zinc dependent phospholipase C family protein [Occallatibacter riparius]